MADTTALLQALSRIEAKLDKLVERSEDHEARVLVTESLSRSFWRVSTPRPVLENVLKRFRADIGEVEAARKSPDLSARVHRATRGLLESLGVDPQDSRWN